MDSLKNSWYIIYTRTNCEMAAKNSLDCEAVVPMIQEVVHTKDRAKTVLKPRYRNYVYVKHDGTENFFERVLLNDHVVKFLSKIPVPAPDINEIIKHQTPRTIITCGDNVKVIDGQFNGLCGKVIGFGCNNECTVGFKIFDSFINESIPKECLILNV